MGPKKLIRHVHWHWKHNYFWIRRKTSNVKRIEDGDKLDKSDIFQKEWAYILPISDCKNPTLQCDIIAFPIKLQGIWFFDQYDINKYDLRKELRNTWILGLALFRLLEPWDQHVKMLEPACWRVRGHLEEHRCPTMKFIIQLLDHPPSDVS